MESRNKIAVVIIVALVAFYVLYINIDNIVSAVTDPFVKDAQIKEDNCRKHCIEKLDALDFSLDGIDCKCWFDVLNCKGHCTSIGAYGYDFEDDFDTCRCWFK